ncbi:MAG: acyl-ACP desaturase [Hymenobacter sp.]
MEKIFEVDASEMMLAFEDMMRKKIVMPAHYMRELGIDMGKTLRPLHRRCPAHRRVHQLRLHRHPRIRSSATGKLSISPASPGAAEKARDYVMALPARLRRVSRPHGRCPSWNISLSGIS